MSIEITKNRNKRPQGVPTRGNTFINRLRQTATFLTLYDPSLMHETDALFVDLGMGANPRTTIEWKSALDRLKNEKRVKLIGTDIVSQRVREAQQYSTEELEFRVGGFNTPLKRGEQAHAIRAMNILRQYRETDVYAAHQLMGDGLAENGLLLEGTSSPLGRIWTANLLRRKGKTLELEALVFGSTIANRDLSWKLFASVLPKTFVHQIKSCEVLRKFFQAWQIEYAKIKSLRLPIRNQFRKLAKGLQEHGFEIKLQSSLLKRGMMVWNIAKDLSKTVDDPTSIIYRNASSWDKKFQASLTGQ